MKKITSMISVMIMLVTAAGAVETMPVLSAVLIGGMAVMVKIGKLYEQ